MKTLNYIFGILAASLALAGLAIFNYLIAPALGAWTAVFNVAYILAALIFVSHHFNVSIPGVRQVLRRAYYRVKFKCGGKKGIRQAGAFTRGYLQVLVYLMWLFKETEEGFETIKEEADHFYSKAMLVMGNTGGKAGKKELLHLHKKHQNRATALSLTALFILVVGTVVTGLISSFIFPAVFQSQAATYTWTQTDWSGGATSSVAAHPGDQDGWKWYESKDSNIQIDGSGNITLESTSQEIVDTTTGDFHAGEDNAWMTHTDDVRFAFDAGAQGCGDFGVFAQDLPNKHDWSGAKTACSDLCTNCALPTKNELLCICNNKSNLGSNFQSARYWSSTENNNNNAYNVDFSDCSSNNNNKSNSYYVRCVRR